MKEVEGRRSPSSTSSATTYSTTSNALQAKANRSLRERTR